MKSNTETYRLLMEPMLWFLQRKEAEGVIPTWRVGRFSKDREEAHASGVEYSMERSKNIQIKREQTERREKKRSIGQIN